MKFLKSVLSISLAATLLFSVAATGIFDWTWGEITAMTEQQVAPETVYRKITLSSPIGPQSINTIEFNPKNRYVSMRAGLSNGEIHGTQSVASMAADFNKKGEGQVIAGINADYFNFGEGVPFGIFMDGGEILSTPPQYSVAFGIKNDGTPFCQSHGTIMNKTLIINDAKTQLSAINCQHIGNDSLVLYNTLFDSSTRSSSDCYEVVCSVISGEFRHGETLSLVVDEIFPEGGNTAIPKDCVVLSARGNSKNVILPLTVGDEFSVQLEFNEFWSDVDFAVSGNYLVLKDGEIQNVSSSERTARTLIGIKPDGNVVFYTIDGKMSNFSVGATHKQAAQIMRDLGCVDAVNLDGGGSTTFVLRDLGARNPKMINRSASNTARAVANSALLVNTAPPSRPTKLILAEGPTKLLVGMSYKYKLVGGIDENYLSYEISSPITWSVDPEIGEIDENGLFVPTSSGDVTISAHTEGISGETHCTVVDFADTITAPEELTIKAGETVDIDVSLLHGGVSLDFTNNLLGWEVTGDIGEFESPGKFKAGEFLAQGEILITHGELTKRIRVTIDGPKPFDPEPFDDMQSHLWANDAVARLFHDEIVRGVSEVEFSPAREIKRADFMLMLMRLMKIEIDRTAENQFEDVPEGSYYYYELATAKRLGITQGTSPTTFSPERSITRQEMFTLTWRTLNIKAAEDLTALDTFADKDSIAEYAKPAIATLTGLGLIAGDNNGFVNPIGNTTRAEAAVFLDRVNTYIKGAE